MSKKRFVRNSKQKKQLIFQTFAKLVREEGYDKLSTRHIAETANISIGTIYHYFPEGKHAIASGFIEHITHQLFDLEMFKEIDLQNLQEFLTNYIKKHLKIHRQNLEIHRAIDQAILADRKVFHRHQEKTKYTIQKISEELKELGIYRDLPKSFILQNLFLFFNLLEAIIHRHLFITPFFNSDEEFVEFLVSFFSCLIQNEILFSLS